MVIWPCPVPAQTQLMKASGVEIYVVAFGSYINGIDEIVKAASYPPERHLFIINNFAGFWNIIKLIVKQFSPGKCSVVNYDPPCWSERISIFILDILEQSWTVF